MSLSPRKNNLGDHPHRRTSVKATASRIGFPDYAQRRAVLSAAAIVSLLLGCGGLVNQIKAKLPTPSDAKPPLAEAKPAPQPEPVQPAEPNSQKTEKKPAEMKEKSADGSAKWSKPAKTLYTPVEADFRPTYDADKKNQRVQPWREYWSWVSQYYRGNLFSQGWTRECTFLLSAVKNAKTRDELRGMLNALGKRMAAEWSKDNNVRKIDTRELQSIGRRFLEARRKDNGSGKVIRELIETLWDEVQKKTK
jgi:hypothetical protein